MKRNILHTIWAAALLLTACTQDELAGTPDVGGANVLAITVTDGGYASTDKNITRVVENGYRTEFTAGDECGLYIVRGGAVVYDNVKLTATASADGNVLTWQSEADVTLVGGFPDESWFLYYPYQSDMSGKTTVSATDAEGFFATLVSGWQPKTGPKYLCQLHGFGPDDRQGHGKQGRKQTESLLLHDPPHGAGRHRDAKNGV